MRELDSESLENVLTREWPRGTRLGRGEPKSQRGEPESHAEASPNKGLD